MSISLTDNAATRVRTFLAKRGHGVGLRLGVRRSGCNGWAYTIDYADGVTPEDVVFIKEGLNEAFKFRNPNVKGECGCGESFSV
jgi:iron-sulfur cluster assembly protein